MASSITSVTFHDLAQAVTAASEDTTPYVVDVREPDEWAAGHLAVAHSIPLGTVPNHVSALPSGEVWVHCARGGRALKACDYLASQREDLTLYVVSDKFESASSTSLKVVR